MTCKYAEDMDYCIRNECECYRKVPGDMIDPPYDECLKLRDDPNPADEDCIFYDDYRATHPEEFEDEEE